MFSTSQCHQPAPPVGASGSWQRSAKLFVPSGAPDHTSAGERFCPVQPKLLKTCSMPIVPSSRKFGLLRVKGAFFLLAIRTSVSGRSAERRQHLADGFVEHRV